MKKLLLISAITFGILSSSFAQQWVDISDRIPGESQSLYDIHFVSHDTGWITSLSNPVIYYTTDAARTFVSQDNEYETDILAIFMLNANEGYAGGNSGIVYKTINIGEDWDFHGTLGGTTITDIIFPHGATTASTGYGCGNDGKIFEITSSGISQVPSNTASDLKSLTFPYSTEGWVCGYATIRHYTSGVWHADQAFANGGYNSIYFVLGTTQGWCVGSAGRIIHTIDGINWQGQPNPDTIQNILYDVFFLDTSTGWAVGTGGIILHTIDGGANWTIQTSGTTNTLSKVFAVSSNVYVTGAGVLLKWGEELSVTEFDVGFDFEMFHNPAVNEFKVQSLNFKVSRATIEIYDLNGKKLLEKQIPAGSEEVTVDVSSLESGLYLCRLIIENKSVTKKLIIQK